jgi:hypothetical protein
LVRGFGIAQCGGKSAEQSGADNPDLQYKYSDFNIKAFLLLTVNCNSIFRIIF